MAVSSPQNTASVLPLFPKYLLSAYHMPGTVLANEGKDMVPISVALQSSEGDNEQVNRYIQTDKSAKKKTIGYKDGRKEVDPA